IILTGIDNDIYSTVDACSNACEMWKAIKRLKQGESINVQDLETNLYWEFGKFTSQDEPIYDQEPSMVAEDDETSKDKEIDKLMALISLSNGNVVGARETIGSSVVQKSSIQCYNCKEFGHVARECQKPKRAKDAAYHREKMLLCKQEEAGIQLNAEQGDWRDDTDDDELEDQELEAHYMYMAQLQEVSPDAADSGPSLMKNHCKREEIDQNDDDNDLAKEREIEDFKSKNKSLESSNNFFKEANNKLFEINDLLYADYKKSQAELARRDSKEWQSAPASEY
nr:hypothetical protein [Tanacetum cinerariifolium]